MVHIKIGVDFPKTVQINICYPDHGLSLFGCRKALKGAKREKIDFLI